MMPYYLYLSFKNQDIFFPAKVNISLKNGGFFTEDKKEILENILDEYLPKSLYISKNDISENIIVEICQKKIEFPLIAKPLNEQRGKNVEIVFDENQLDFYHKKLGKDFVIQEFVSYPLELAILASRIPGNAEWIVSSITRKEFLSVLGDGKNDIISLLKTDKRALLIWEDLMQNVKMDWSEILPKGENRIIEKIGNHCRGTIFRDAVDIDKGKVALVVGKILENFEGFNYGRFDLKVKSIADLYAGKNIKILELNGVNADCAHVFDPDYKLLNAYKDIAWHWNRLSKIAKLNTNNTVRFKDVYANLRNNF